MKVFQDFFVDLDLPVTLTQGDQVSIPIGLYNYTGAAGPVVAEFAYRNDYITARAQYKLADEVFRRDKCQATPAAAAPAPAVPPADTTQKHQHQHLGSGVY